jgi:iron(III) transport system ATP-binding protein
MSLLRCTGIEKSYGPVHAVRGVDLELDEGTLLALLGPSGCGKTTLLRLIAGFEHPDAGTILLRDTVLASPTAWRPPEKRRVGLVFQDYALFPHLTVARNVAFGAPKDVDRKRRVAEMLELVGLGGMGRRMPHELSGGQQQRVALARTLASQPEVVLLDEPFSNLDPTLRERVRAEVWAILERFGATAIIVTHDQAEALSLPGLVAVMLEGRVVQVGTPREVYAHPVSKPVGAFVGEANFLPATWHGEASVDCELGIVPVRGQARGAMEVMIRPEGLALTQTGGVRGEVVAVAYYGHDSVATVRLASGRELKVRTGVGWAPGAGEQAGVEVRGEAIVFGDA